MNKTQPDLKSAEEFKLYENPDYNFKIKYPIYLEASESNLYPYQAVKFIIPTENIFQTPDIDVSILVYSGLPSNLTSSDLSTKSEIPAYNLLKDNEIRLVSSNFSETANHKAFNLVYYDYSGATTRKVNTIYILDNRDVFLIIYSTQPGLFNTHLQDFKKMIGSLEIVPENNSSLNTLAYKIDEYANYFATFTQDSANLTRPFQDEIALWQSGMVSNETMIELTDTYLVNFTKQMNEFNQTESPDAFESAKNSLVNSSDNEIKSYQYFKDYLLDLLRN